MMKTIFLLICLSISVFGSFPVMAEKIIVIGAGISGLKAAKDLKAAGEDVIVLEARNRIGGRIHTSHKWPDAPIDLGGSWIHGIYGPKGFVNPIYTLAKQLGLELLATDVDKSQLYRSDGTPLNSKEEKAVYGEGWALASAARSFANVLGMDISVKTAIDEVMGGYIPPPKIQQQWNFIFSIVENLTGADIAKESALYDDYVTLSSPDHLLLKYGYGQIIDYLAKGLDIRLNQVVKEVRIEPHDVMVKVNQGTRYFADRVVVTLPLGVLKSGDVQFEPPLPAAKQHAIDVLGMGLLDKLVLRFDHVFWKKDEDMIVYMSSPKGIWTTALDFSHVYGQPILAFLNPAAFAEQTESWTDKQIVNSAMTVLKTLYGPNIPQPEDYQITRWKSDPFAYGSYSYSSVGSTPADRDALGKPIDNRVFFAGEATNRYFYSTVHGAYLSGERVAKSILSLP